jgi:hypothetical protein
MKKKKKKSHQSECPLSVHLQEPVTASHRQTVLSLPPEAMTVPTAEKARELTLPLQNRSQN